VCRVCVFQYEILLCVQDQDDPAVDVCKKLLGKYPNVDAGLFIGGKKVGINPKINNLMPGYEAAKYGLTTHVQVYFGTSHPRSYISANVTGIKCVTGMSCLMRKDVLDQAGGLVAFAQYIAEDYFMAKAIADRLELQHYHAAETSFLSDG
ncbi:hypothetical protein XENOCAPTIV_004501, partial [Xenoophorus captivus]